VKTIHIEAFDKSSVDKAIEEVKAIKKEWRRKTKLCSERIAEALAAEIQKNLDAIPYTDDVVDVKNHIVMPLRAEMSAKAIRNRVVVNGVDIAFVEFGAGIYHNASKYNALSSRVQFDTATGSYGKGQGNQPYWFIRHDRISRGTPMYAPIVLAIEAIEPQIPTICREVFV